MTAGAPLPRSTHQIRVDGDRVIKTYVGTDHGEAVREWSALRHLARHADGLAPAPIAAGLDARPTWIVMTRLPGSTPARWSDADRDAVAAALERLWSVPTDGLAEQRGSPAFEPAFWRQLVAESPEPDDPVLGQTRRQASRWLAGVELDRVLSEPGVPVLGQGDPNADNFLLAGSARLVDFEDAGRSRRGFELANLIEHAANRHCGFEALADRFEVPPSELRSCRRLMAIFWFVRFISDPTTASRNPPGYVQTQSEHLRTLLLD